MIVCYRGNSSCCLLLNYKTMGNLFSSATICETCRCETSECQCGGSAKIPLHFLLIGRTGDGKSSTGNSILGRKKFVAVSNTSSVTKKVKVAWAKHGRYDIKIVDTPGLKDTDLKQTEDIEQAVTSMAKALILCNGGVHAFLLVMKFGERYTPEMKAAISDLKDIFGENYFKERGIIVLTRGDNFAETMKSDDTPGKSFETWIREQKGDYKELIKECSSRVVLFNNRTQDIDVKSDQRNNLFKYGEEFSRKGTYTSEYFEMYRKVRQKLIIKNNFPLLKENFQKKIKLLITELVDLSRNPSLEDVDHLETQINDLLADIENEVQSEESLQAVKTVLLQKHKHAEALKTAKLENNTTKIKAYVDALQSNYSLLNKTTKYSWIEIFSSILFPAFFNVLISARLSAVKPITFTRMDSALKSAATAYLDK